MRVLTYLLLSTAVRWDNEGGTGAGGGGGPAQAPAEAHRGTPAAAPAEGGAKAPVNEVARPEYLPEKFWDATAKAPRVEELANSYREVERRLSMRTDDLSKTLAEDFKASQFRERPESADKYVLAPTKHFADAHLGGKEFQGNPDDPLFQTFSKIAHARGLSQEEFSQCVDGYLTSLAMQMPDPVAELKALGAKAVPRIENAKKWVGANVPKAHAAVVGQIAGTAAGIEFLEWVKEVTGEPLQGDLRDVMGETHDDSGVPSEEELYALMATDGYSDPMRRDPNVVNKVTKGWAAIAKFNASRKRA